MNVSEFLKVWKEVNVSDDVVADGGSGGCNVDIGVPFSSEVDDGDEVSVEYGDVSRDDFGGDDGGCEVFDEAGSFFYGQRSKRRRYDGLKTDSISLCKPREPYACLRTLSTNEGSYDNFVSGVSGRKRVKVQIAGRGTPRKGSLAAVTALREELLRKKTLLDKSCRQEVVDSSTNEEFPTIAEGESTLDELLLSVEDLVPVGNLATIVEKSLAPAQTSSVEDPTLSAVSTEAEAPLKVDEPVERKESTGSAPKAGKLSMFARAKLYVSGGDALEGKANIEDFFGKRFTS
ncbi:hypothetical protein DPX39_070030400 [Trypanosoma brucei equiperdum]|uniref:Uncharacterized protein n=1 Tax=Trypanosoma brucei equiperdum TaxID=630700 RepID=A0A3L6L478_9TRYP|nr:hypothetical protein DPX39_070030400 [Trypanosoma brucei equiperdum]